MMMVSACRLGNPQIPFDAAQGRNLGAKHKGNMTADKLRRSDNLSQE